MAKDEGTNRKAFLVGVFVATGLALLVFFVFSIQGLQNQFHDSRTVTVLFEHVGGLQAGQAVHYAGHPVGKVQSVTIPEDAPSQLRATLSVPADLPLFNNTTVTISSTGLIGEKIVDILPPDTPGKRISSDRVMKGKQPVSMTEVLERIRKILGKDSEQRLEKIMDNAITVSQNLKTVSESLKTLTGENRHEFNQVLENLSEGTEKLPPLLDRADTTVRSLNRLSRNLTTLSKKLSRFSDENSTELKNTIRNLETTSRHLEVFSEKLSNSPSILLWGE